MARPPTHRRSVAIAIAAAGALAAAVLASVSCAFPDFPFRETDDLADGGMADASPSGACAHDCMGGACLGGVCQPLTLYADPAGGPGGIYVTDLGVVFFTQYYGGRVVRELADGGSSFPAMGLANPVRITGSAQGTFATAFANGDAATAGVVSLGTTGAPKRIVSGPKVAGLPIAPWGIVDTGKLLVWTNAVDDGSVMVAAADGGSAAVLATGGHPQEIAANAEFAWWIDANRSRLFRAPLGGDGGAPAVVATPDFVDFLAYAAGHLYTASYVNTSSIGVLDDATSTGVAVRELVSRYARLPGSDEPAVHTPHGVAVDDAYVYWVNTPGAGPTGSVVRARLDGTAPPELLAAHVVQPDQIAVTATAIYWTSFAGTVQRLAKP